MKNYSNRILIGAGRLLANPSLWRFLRAPRPRYAAAWLTTAVAGVVALIVSWTYFDNDQTLHRNDGNSGHVTIDFGGQYLMGRMLVRGHARHLYERSYQRQVLEEVYPRGDEEPDQE